MVVGEVIDQAIEHHRAGKLDAAAALYEQVLSGQPGHADANHLLGVICYQRGQYDRAVDLIRRAIAADPSQQVFHNALGLALEQLGQLEEAESSFRAAIELASPEGIAATSAEELSRKTVSDGPGNKGSEVSRKDVGTAQACHNLGRLLSRRGKYGEAVEWLEKAVRLNADHAGAYASLGDSRQSLGRLDLAAAAYQKAVTLDAQQDGAWYGLGCVYSRLGHYAAATGCLMESLKVAPNRAPVHHNLGQSLLKLGRVDEAIDEFHKSVGLGGGDFSLGAIAIAIPGSPNADHRAVLEARRAGARHATAEIRPVMRSVTEGSRQAKGGLLIGYVSSFFHKRNWMKPVWALLNQHDRDRFEVHIFSDAPENEVGPGYHRRESDRYYDTSGLDNRQVAELIQRCGIDVLVDLNGYSDVGRLAMLAYRPAGVIVGWFNMYATTGLEAVDYLIGDEQVIRPEEEAFYSEKILRVAGSYLTFCVDYPVPDVVAPPCVAWGGGVTFGCLASQYKITPQVAGAWAEILKRCPRSRLVIKNAAMKSPANRRYMQEMFAGLGIAPERVGLDGPSEHFEFLKKYDEIDVALDTFPYNGGTTTTEAIWQGVPVVTFYGDRWVARTSASILRAGGLGEFVAKDLQGYIDLAVALGQESTAAQRLAGLRATMRARLAGSPVCDTASFAREMEALYRKIAGVEGARGG